MQRTGDDMSITYRVKKALFEALETVHGVRPMLPAEALEFLALVENIEKRYCEFELEPEPDPQ